MATSLPTPTPMSTPPASPPSISAEINTATRKQHTELNRLIIERLPLALPSHASNPALLGQGLAAFATIFFAFEDAWAAVPKTRPENEAIDPQRDAVVAWLNMLRPAGLERSPRLRRDLQHISGMTGVDVSKRILKQLPIDGGSLRDKPHLLVAYAWVMYMAVFSGGRWIRQQLFNAGPGFWHTQPDPQLMEKAEQRALLQAPGFSFLSFDGEEDGEDVKQRFKAQLAHAETLLSPQQRQEVVEEAHRLFGHCIALVHGLDSLVRQQKVRRSLAVSLVVVYAVLITVWLYNFVL